MAKTIFEQMGGTYTMQGDYRLPDLRFTPSVYGDSDICGTSGNTARCFTSIS